MEIVAIPIQGRMNIKLQMYALLNCILLRCTNSGHLKAFPSRSKNLTMFIQQSTDDMLILIHKTDENTAIYLS
jgi:hypothetical protein